MTSEEFLNPTIDEILEEAKYGKSLIIVEGEYDYIYEYIADDIKTNKYEIIPIEELIGKKGNLALETLILEIEQFAKEEELEYIPYIIGIIDRDYRKYEEKLTNSNILYILEFYSIESYFVNREVLYKLLKFSIRSKRLMNDDFVNLLYSELSDKLVNDLYLKSIKKLEKHLEIDEVIDKFKFNKLFEILLKITKGKELLTRFLVEIQNILSSQKLYKLCRDEEVISCHKYNDEEHEIFCLYRTQKYDIPQLRKYAFEQVNLESLTPIKNRLKQLN
ncbi:MAG: hypothetical protein QM493_02020 [Sulfurovum sp.]